MPAGCKFSAPPRFYARDTTNLFFLAVDHDPSSLAVATGQPENEETTATRGLLNLRKGTSRDIPWLHLTDPPIMASSSVGWIALLAEQDTLEGKVRVWRWTQGGKLDLLAQGDHLDPIDVRCGAKSCVFLTTLVANVATRGASLFFGTPDQASASMKRIDIVGDKTLKGSSPLRITAWDEASRSALVAFDSPSHIQFFRVTHTEIANIGNVKRGNAVLDTFSNGINSAALMTRGQSDDDGCAVGQAKLEIAKVGGPSTLLPCSVLPDWGYARRLGRGAFVTWIAPTNCKVPKRKVVHGVVLDETAIPISSVMAIGTANGHAISTEGDEVHLWLRGPKGVTWLQAKCSDSAPHPKSSTGAPESDSNVKVHAY